MYPVSVVGTAASSDVPDDEDNCVSSEGKDEEVVAQSAILGGGLQQAEAAALTSAIVVGKGVSTYSKGKAPAKRRGTAVVSTASTVVRVSARSNKGKAPVKGRGIASVLTTSTAVGVSANSKGKAPVKGRGIVSVLTTSTAVGVSAKSKGKAPAKKRGIAAAVSGCTVDPDVLSALGVVLSPDGVQIIAGLFSRVNEFAKRFYNSMVSKQLPSSLSDKLSLIERAIWYSTYRKMCEDVFVLVCLGEYHTKHRPDFILALPRIKVLPVLSDFRDSVAVPLAGDSLLNFLSRLDRAVRTRLESIFISNWNKASASLEEVGLSDVSCKDFVSVLDAVGIPQAALSMLVASSSIEKEINRGTLKRTASGVITAPDAPGPPAPGSRSNLFRRCCRYYSRLGSLSTLGGASGALSELNLLPSSVGDYGAAGSSSGPTAAKKRRPRPRPSRGVVIPVSTHSGTNVNVVRAPVWMPPPVIDTLLSISVPYSHVRCIDLLGFKLHPDSVGIIHRLFFRIRKFFMYSLGKSTARYISTAMSSKLSGVGRVIWLKTYRELHLCNFVSKCFCIYHAKYRPTFIRVLADIRVLSSSADHSPVPLSGDSLVDFLSRLDCVIADLARAMFNSKWDMESAKIFSELKGELLSNVVCEDFIKVLSDAGIPIAARSVYHKYTRSKSYAKNRGKTLGRRRAISKSKTSVDSGVITTECVASVDDVANPMQSSSSSVRLHPKLSSAHESSPKYRLRPRRTVSVFDESSSSTDNSDYYCGSGVLAGVSSPAPSSPPSISFAPLSPPSSSPSPSPSPSPSAESHDLSGVQLGSLFLLEEDPGKSTSRFVKLLHCRDQSTSRFVKLFYYRDQSSSGFVKLFSCRDQSASVFATNTDSTFVALSEDAGSSSLPPAVSDLIVLEDESSSSSESGSSSSESGSSSSESGSSSSESGSSSSESGSSSRLYDEDAYSSFVTQLVREYLEAPTSGSVAAGSSSSSFSADVSDVSPVVAGTSAEDYDVGSRMAELLNRDMQISPLPVGESSGSIGDSGGLSSSLRGSTQRRSGRKRKRMS
ncbi:hypothetical protein [Candidatus Ichthyocystis sparus]|uniref:hypothetical protein n=1 Tax=Candidatus Ichthyocystis sparus TaxID=1561004 RepID=UPI000ABA5C3E|nr:hypothetical protein [Candidatus Ichthyocystis sparus]